MTSHELANMLLSFPDMPVATHAHGHTYHSVNHRTSHGPLKVVAATLGFASNPPTMVIGDVFEHIDSIRKRSFGVADATVAAFRERFVIELTPDKAKEKRKPKKEETPDLLEEAT